MWPVSDAFREAVRGPDITMRIRATILDPDLAPLRVLRPTDGSVRVDTTNPIRRTCALTIADALIPSSTGPLWWSHPILVEYGLLVGGAVEWVPVGVYLMDEPEHVVGSGVLTLSGRDRLKLAAEHDLPETVTFPDGYRVGQAIRDRAEACRMGTSDDLYDIDDAGATLVGDHTYEASVNDLELMRTLATDHALDLHCRPDGPLRVRPVNVATEPVASYRRGSGVRLVSFRARWRDRVRNRVIVIAEGATPPLRGEAAVTDPLSPAHPDNIGGERIEWYRSAGLVTQAQANAVAAALLPQVALVEKEIEMGAAVDPSLDGGDVIEVEEPDTATSGWFELVSFTLPLKPGAHLLSVREVTSLYAG